MGILRGKPWQYHVSFVEAFLVSLGIAIKAWLTLSSMRHRSRHILLSDVTKMRACVVQRRFAISVVSLILSPLDPSFLSRILAIAFKSFNVFIFAALVMIVSIPLFVDHMALVSADTVPSSSLLSISSQPCTQSLTAFTHYKQLHISSSNTQPLQDPDNIQNNPKPCPQIRTEIEGASWKNVYVDLNHCEYLFVEDQAATHKAIMRVCMEVECNDDPSDLDDMIFNFCA